MLEAKALIGSTAQLEFRERICGEESEPPAGMSQELWLVERCNNPQYYQEQATDIDPDNLTDAFASAVETSPYPVVNVVFDDEGADEFFKLTERVSLRNDRLAIYLDDEELVAPGVDRSVGGIAGGRAIIEGRFTPDRARTIAIQLRSGALPVTLDLIQERSVDATLGDDSLQKSLIAGGVGLVLLLIFMVMYYKIPGLIAAIALIMYTTLLLAIFKGIPRYAHAVRGRGNRSFPGFCRGRQHPDRRTHQGRTPDRPHADGRNQRGIQSGMAVYPGRQHFDDHHRRSAFLVR